jgi:hypothetical protein
MRPKELYPRNMNKEVGLPEEVMEASSFFPQGA